MSLPTISRPQERVDDWIWIIHRTVGPNTLTPESMTSNVYAQAITIPHHAALPSQWVSMRRPLSIKRISCTVRQFQLGRRPRASRKWSILAHLGLPVFDAWRIKYGIHRRSGPCQVVALPLSEWVALTRPGAGCRSCARTSTHACREHLHAVSTWPHATLAVWSATPSRIANSAWREAWRRPHKQAPCGPGRPSLLACGLRSLPNGPRFCREPLPPTFRWTERAGRV